MPRRSRTVRLIIMTVSLCILFVGCDVSGSQKNYPNLFEDVLGSAKYYLVWDSDCPEEYSLCLDTRFVSSDNGDKITALEGLLNVLADTDCYLFGRDINKKLPKEIRLNEKEMEESLESGRRILKTVLKKCRLVIYGLDEMPVLEDGIVKINKVNYAIYLAKGYLQDPSLEEFNQQNRWVIIDTYGEIVVVGGGTYKDVFTAWWSDQSSVFRAGDQMLKYRPVRVEAENLLVYKSLTAQ